MDGAAVTGAADTHSQRRVGCGPFGGSAERDVSEKASSGGEAAVGQRNFARWVGSVYMTTAVGHPEQNIAVPNMLGLLADSVALYRGRFRWC